MTAPTRVLSLLVKARALVAKKDGWCKGVYLRRLPNGRYQYCAGGALGYVANGDPCAGAAWRALARAVPATMPHASPQEFNDAPATRQEDVVALYDRAIAAVGAA